MFRYNNLDLHLYREVRLVALQHARGKPSGHIERQRLEFVKDKDKIIRKAKETMEIYAPLADRMGMNRIRDELEDLSF